MKAETHLTLPREEDPTEAIARFVRGKWSSDFVVGRTRSMNQYEREVSVDAHRVDLIQDAATEDVSLPVKWSRTLPSSL